MRKAAPTVSLLLAVAIAASCAQPGSSEDDALPPASVVIQDGATTTVMNQDRPLWRGPVELVEQASIGSAEGSEEYLLGSITSIAASEDSIYIADIQAVKVRAYDLDGTHLRDIGGQGPGPGEFQRPWDVAIRDDGSILIRDQIQRRVHTFTPEGALIDDWAAEGGSRAAIGTDGTVYAIREQLLPDEGGEVTVEMRRYGAEGADEEWQRLDAFEPTASLTVDYDQLEGMARFVGPGGDWQSARWPPFAPKFVAQVSATGSMLYGRAHADGFELLRDDGSVWISREAYRFDVRHPGGTTMIVKKEWSPVAVETEEGDWHRRRLTAMWRTATDPGWTWVGGEIPAQKGAYEAIVPAVDGPYWVIRPLAGEPIDGCDSRPADYYGYVEAPCWRQPYAADVFDIEGRFLGSVPMPDGVRYHVRPFIRGDMVVALLESADGVAYVKRYQLRTGTG